MMEREPEACPGPGKSIRGLRALFLGAILLAVAGASVIGFWKHQGVLGLRGSLAGLLLGGLAASAGLLLRRRIWSARGPKVVREMMLSLVASFGIFTGGAVILALAWREGAMAVLLTALGIYLTVSLFEALSAGA